MIKACFVFLLVASCWRGDASAIILNTKKATVWLPKQTISGTISGGSTNKLKWHLNNSSGFVNVHENGSFSFSVLLTEKHNIIWVEDVSDASSSDTIHYILGYKPVAEVKPFAVITNNNALLNIVV